VRRWTGYVTYIIDGYDGHLIVSELRCRVKAARLARTEGEGVGVEVAIIILKQFLIILILKLLRGEGRGEEVWEEVERWGVWVLVSHKGAPCSEVPLPRARFFVMREFLV